MIQTDNIRKAYEKYLAEAPNIDQRELEVELGVGLGPGIKKFSLRGNEAIISGSDKETGKYGATINITGKRAKVKMTFGKLSNKLQQRIIDAFDKFNIDVAFGK